MKALYMLSGAFAMHLCIMFDAGRYRVWPVSLLLGLVCFIGAEHLHGSQQRRIKQALRNLRELGGILGDR